MNYFILFIVPLLSGLTIKFIPQGRLANYKLMLVFAGSYLFAISVTHILPELYRIGQDVEFVGVFVLAGFFLQQVLEYFTSGVEHGHLSGTFSDHHHKPVSLASLVIALSIHAFLEGSMLAQPKVGDGHLLNGNLVLLGIVFHRAPAAFALMSLVTFQSKEWRLGMIYLFIFSFASPLGLLSGELLSNYSLLEGSAWIYIYALVCGNFLHISTTIVFESSPGHRFEVKKLLVGLIGAVLAIFSELVL